MRRSSWIAVATTLLLVLAGCTDDGSASDDTDSGLGSLEFARCEGEDLSRQETTIDGRDAVVVEQRSEGEALLPEGERSYTYTVDLDGRILVATTNSVGETDYERDRSILDRMMDPITIHADG